MVFSKEKGGRAAVCTFSVRHYCSFHDECQILQVRGVTQITCTRCQGQQ